MRRNSHTSQWQRPPAAYGANLPALPSRRGTHRTLGASAEHVLVLEAGIDDSSGRSPRPPAERASWLGQMGRDVTWELCCLVLASLLVACCQSDADAPAPGVHDGVDAAQQLPSHPQSELDETEAGTAPMDSRFAGSAAVSSPFLSLSKERWQVSGIEGQAQRLTTHLFIDGSHGEWAVEGVPDWLQLERASGALPDVITLTVDTGALELGRQDTTLVFTAADIEDVSELRVEANLLADVGFGAATRIAASDSNGPLHAQPADFDDDGDLDVAVVDALGTVQWFDNDGQGRFGTARVLAEGLPVSALAAGDLDGDGDQDLLAFGAITLWFESADGNLEKLHYLAPHGFSDVELVDLDGDRDADLLGLYNSELWVAELDEQARKATFHALGSVDTTTRLKVGDLNADGIADVAVGGSSVAWFAGKGGFDFAEAQEIDVDSQRTETLDIGDYDRDGRNELLNGADVWTRLSKLTAEGEWDTRILDESTSLEGIVAFIDLGGSTLGLVTAPTDLAPLLPYSTDRRFRPYGDAPLTVFLPDGAAPLHIEDPSQVFSSVSVVDIDADGRDDLLATIAEADRVFWRRNLGAEGFGPANPIGISLGGVHEVLPYDIDLDGDADLVSASLRGGGIHIHENTEPGTWTTPRPLNSEPNLGQLLQSIDLDEDGAPELVYRTPSGPVSRSATSGELGPQLALPHASGQVAVLDLKGEDTDLRFFLSGVGHPNDDGGDLRSVSVLAPGVYSEMETTFVAGPVGAWTVADVNEDGQDDIVAAGDVRADATGAQLVYLTGSEGDQLELSDIDGDGNPDAVVNEPFGPLTWYRWNVGLDEFEQPGKRIDDDGPNGGGFALADFDRDGDIDVVAGAFTVQPEFTSHQAEALEDEPLEAIAWYENTAGVFAAHLLPGRIGNFIGLSTTDVDEDGDPDILFATSGHDAVYWYENRLNE